LFFTKVPVACALPFGGDDTVEEGRYPRQELAFKMFRESGC
jgi:hypothetical protein